MSSKFRTKKDEILNALSKPENDYSDASPKGSVDDGVRDLIELINDADGFVTTSSCAGRVAVYLEGPPKSQPKQFIAAELRNISPYIAAGSPMSRAPIASAGGKGGGRWLFSSHSPVDLRNFEEPGMIYRLFGFPCRSEVAFPAAGTKPQFIHFKFEPMIIHILTNTAADANAALQIATQAGFRESGISGLLESNGRPSTPMVAVRSSGLALDSIIGFRDPNASTTGTPMLLPMVPESYLRSILHIANERFVTNHERRERFYHAFYQHTMKNITAYSPNDSTDSFETKEARRERKRIAGLERQREMLLVGGALDGERPRPDETSLENGEDFGFEMFTNGEEHGMS